jgi:hypothetical protein
MVRSTRFTYRMTKLFEEIYGWCYVRTIIKIQGNENNFHYKEYLR